jgi:SAM-dependent methyltransferase
MNTLVEINKYYNFPTDKGSGQGIPNTGHCYLKYYDDILSKYKDKNINFLEIGLAVGGSILLWNKYFSNANNIIGIDIDTSRVGQYQYFPPETLDKLNINVNVPPYSVFEWINNIKIIQKDIKESVSLFNDIKFDIIIDDGSHAPHDQEFVINNFVDKLTDDGILIIEDIQPHSYDLIEKYKSILPNSYVLDLRYVQNQYDDILYIIRK